MAAVSCCLLAVLVGVGVVRLASATPPRTCDGGAASPSLLDAILLSGTLRVGTPGDYAPYSKWHAGRPAGVDVQLVEELARHLGVGVAFVNTTWHSLVDDQRVCVTEMRATEGFQTGMAMRIASAKGGGG